MLYRDIKLMIFAFLQLSFFEENITIKIKGKAIERKYENRYIGNRGKNFNKSCLYSNNHYDLSLSTASLVTYYLLCRMFGRQKL